MLTKSEWSKLSVEQKRAYLEKVSGSKPDPIAVVGISGRYAEADNLEQFWENLKLGKDCVKEVPIERWDSSSIYHPEKNTPHKIYSKWGSFLTEIDKFDSLFFNISPHEAAGMDPQERMILEVAWSAIEDAGYDPQSLGHQCEGQGQVGVFMGVMWNEYQLLYKEETEAGVCFGNSNNSFLANRISYYLDFSGPSLVIDTACSSSLVAVHMACESIWRGDCQYALAGGVNLSLHPTKYLILSKMGMLSEKGRCRSFGAGGDGYVPGEGIGVVFLKPLQQALLDGDRIYGTILSSHMNHGGKANGFTVPNPDAQAELIKKALEKGAISSESISYIEGHGTGTTLGDPIEITGLCKAFGESIRKQTCALGSVKSNLGHLEGASGIVALTKVLLQLKYKQLVPSLHSKELNPYIKFEETPFYVQQEAADWKTIGGTRRRAGISSFGAGGTNAHLIVEEAPEYALSTRQSKPYYLLTISAKHPESLKQRIKDLAVHLDRHSDLPLEAVAYTLNVGRAHFEYRFALVVSSIEELQATLKTAQPKAEQTEKREPIFEELLERLLDDFSTKQFDPVTYRKKLLVLADLYIKGYEIDWKILHPGEGYQRINLPTYPFLKRRHWAPTTTHQKHGIRASLQLHPLIGSNVSTLNEQCFRTVLTGDEFYLADHIVSGQKVLPGVVYLEMARAAGDLAWPGKKVTGFQDIIWAEPLVVDREAEVSIRLESQEGQIQYVVYTKEDIHGRGTLVYDESNDLSAWSNVSELEKELVQHFTKEEIYHDFAKMGLHYGKTFQVIDWARTEEGQVLAYYTLPSGIAETEKYGLHPSIIDGALHASGIDILSGLALPFSLEKVKINRKPDSTGYIHVRRKTSHVDLQILDKDGHVCVELENLEARSNTKVAELAYYTPQWKPAPLKEKERTIHSLCVVGRDSALVSELRKHLPDHRVLHLDEKEDYALFIQSMRKDNIKLSHFILANESDAPAYIDTQIHSLTVLLQSLMEAKVDGDLHFVVPYPYESSKLEPGIMVTGLAKSLAQENPRYRMHVVGYNSFTQLVDELKYAQEFHIRYVGDERQVEHYVKEATPQIPGDLPLRQKGVYLITGGLGELGLVFAEYLAKTYQARLILTGRSALTPEKQKQIESMGGEILYLQGDVTDQETVEKWIEAAKARFGSLQGIIHSAGIVEDRLLFQKDWSSFRSVLLPKVLGTIHLDAATAHENLECFVMFSSLASCFGNVGQTDYATGNAFLDAFAHFRSEQVKKGERRGRTLSMNWPLWAEGGMGRNETTIEALKALGMEILPSKQGMEAFVRCLSQTSAPQFIVLYGNQNDLANPSVNLSNTSDLPFAQQEQILEYMRRDIVKTVALVLKLEPEAIHPAKELSIYGFDSIAFTRLANQLKQIYGFSVSQNSFFEYPTIEGLSQHLWRTHTPQLMAHYTEAQMPEIVVSFPETSNSLSIGQEQLFATSLLTPNAATYNIGMAWELIGEVEIAALRKALNIIVERHDAIRMSFLINGEETKAVVQRKIEIDLPIKKSFETGLDVQQLEINEVIEKLHGEPFDLGKAPLFRCCLLQFPNHRNVFIYAMHHIITDGWSLGILNKELMQNYNALIIHSQYTASPLKTSYADFIHWQHRLLGNEEQSILHFWQQKLSSLPDPLQLPTAQRRTGMYRAAGENIVFPQLLAEQLKRFIKRESASLFVCLLSAYQVLLARYANQPDLIIGIPFFGREDEKFENTIGYFINTVPCRTQLSDSLSFADLMKENQSFIMQAQKNQTLSMSKLIRKLNIQRDLSGNHLFKVIFNFINMPISDLKLAGLQSHIIWYEEGQTEYDLNMTIIEEKDSFRLALKYNGDLFDKTFITQLLVNYLKLLESALSNQNSSVWNLEFIGDEEKHKLIEERNQTEIAYQKGKTIHQLFEDQVEKTPHDIAVIFENEQLTYQELNAKANQLAHYLRIQGVKPNSLVALSLDRGLNLPIGLLAVLKAGGAYVPLDPNYPKERLDFMLEDSKASILLNENDIEEKSKWKDLPVTNLDSSGDPSNLAYVIYTSGSTGQPKGVMMSHGSLCNLLEWQKQNFVFKEQVNVLQFSALSFDVCFQECFSTWLNGSTLVLFSENEKRDISAVLHILKEKKINRIFLPFVALSALVEHYKNQRGVLADLREVITAGEQLVISTAVANFLEDHPHCTLVNQYGPTETHVVTSFTLQPPYSDLPPIGRPIANTSLYILDKHRQLVPEGVAGELYIGGKGVASGYLNRPELTEERFIRNPFESRNSSLYQTGDLVRYLPDGNIEYLGRLDEQVKIRGFRVELGEIEIAITSHSQIKQCIVAPHKENGQNSLIAYIVLNSVMEDDLLNELNGYLLQKLPSYMVPTAFVPLESLPLTPSGKVNRKALSLSSNSVVLHAKSSYVAPTKAIELQLTSMWSELLDVKQIGIHDNFFLLGGHSLNGAQLMARIKNHYRMDLPLRSLFKHPTIEELAKLVEVTLKQEQSLIPMLTKQEPGETIPLSFAQQRLWFLDQLIENKATYNIPVALKLTGRLNEAALERSFQKLVNRHESLRTYFTAVEGEPQQVVTPYLFTLERYDLEEEAIEWISRKAMEPFDLTKLPLMRVALVALTPAEHVLLITMHHIISDGWSLDIMVRELNQFYNHYAYEKPLLFDELPVQYVDYTLWQRSWLKGDVLQNQLSYWHEQLKGATGILNFPTDKPRPAMVSHRGKVYQRMIHKNLASGLKSLGEKHQVTLFMTLLSLLQVLLYRYSHQEDIVIGSPMAGRKEKDVEGLIGFFVNTLVLRGNLADRPTFAELLEQAKETTLQAYGHQDIPFEQLVDHFKVNRMLDRHPLFQVMLVLQNTRAQRVNLEELEAALFPIDYQFSKFDLTFSFIEHEWGELGLTIEYATDLFYDSTIEKMADHFVNLIAAVIENVDKRIDDLNLLTESDRCTQLIEWNDTFKDYPRDKTIHQLFEEQVEKTPNLVAVVFEEKELTYAELNIKANQLAHYLRSQGVKQDTLVAISLERSLELVISILGVLKAGGAYVPLDPSYPEDRLQFMLQDSQSFLLITHSKFQDCFANNETGFDNPVFVNHPSDLAYVIYTSGSTGKPKGVMNTHLGLVNRILWMQEQYLLKRTDRVLQKTTFSFDVSVWEFFWPLITGACLVIARPHIHKDAEALIESIQQQKISVIHFVPSMLSNFLEGEKVETCHSLRLVFASGEALSTVLQDRFYHRLNAELHNLYGPTEAAIDVSYWHCKQDCPLHTVPIGKPIANMQLYILDKLLQPVPIGVSGELYIGGVGLARGYLNRPELTAGRFIPHPFASSEENLRLYRTGDTVRYLQDGNIEYLGRMDDQVKIRGFRIEIGEVESAIISYPDVKQCVVIAREDEGDKKLVAYLVTSTRLKEEASADFIVHLRDHISRILPDYMIPLVFVFLENIPLTQSGKVDRHSLPKPDKLYRQQENQFIAPKTELEKKLASLWASLLGVDEAKISINDNFFNLGGHSLLITRLLANVKKQLKLEYTVRDFIEQPTIARMIALSGTGDGSFNKLIHRIEADAQLPRSIKITAKNKPLLSPKVILLTGVTGFVGVHLLKELLNSTDAHVVCLIRGEDESGARSKLVQQLTKYELIDEVDLNRVEILVGDLSKPKLGLPEQQFEWLAREIDTIYHNGAYVHHIYDYESLRATNVVSMVELIQLAVEIKNKRLHFISTISAANSLDENVTFEVLPTHFKQGYIQSKWVAEQLMVQALDRGMEGSIYRLGTVQGQQTTGIVNEGNHVTLLLKSCIQFGVAPRLDMPIEMTPVDIVSKSVVQLSLQSNLPVVYHLNNPQVTDWNTLIDALTRYGYPIQLIDEKQWHQDYLSSLTEENALFALASLYADGFDNAAHRQVHCSKTQLQLKKLGIRYPKIGPRLLGKYIRYLEKVDFLPISL